MLIPPRGAAGKAGLGALSRQITELSLAAPQVVAHRLARMAAAGAAPSARDRREMGRMGAEKVAAFRESWAAMGLQALLAQQRALVSMQAAFWRSCLVPFATPDLRPWLGGAGSHWQRAWLATLQHGLAPVHRRAVANAKRLGAPTR